MALNVGDRIRVKGTAPLCKGEQGVVTEVDRDFKWPIAVKLDNRPCEYYYLEKELELC